MTPDLKEEFIGRILLTAICLLCLYRSNVAVKKIKKMQREVDFLKKIAERHEAMIINTSDVGMENRERTFRILELIKQLRQMLTGKKS